MWHKLWSWFGKTRVKTTTEREKELLAALKTQQLPRHIAIIMDGNGRWAQRRGLPRAAGHRAGADSLREAVRGCVQLGIQVLTVYAFSTENWKRPTDEVNILMNLLVEYLQKELNELHANQVRIKAIGRIEDLPEAARLELAKAEDITRNNSRLILNLALNYGGRTEIVEATKHIASQVKDKRLKIEDIDEEVFASYLYTAGLPDPDLLIRPSGEMRISNYLLWQLAYTEIWVTKVLWPDFRKIHLLEALVSYQKRERRFGGLKI